MATTVSGETFWVVLPDELVADGLVVLPGAPVRVDGDPRSPVPGLTTESPNKAAAAFCEGTPGCEPALQAREVLPNQAILSRWKDRSGSLNLDVTTLELGTWTLVLSGSYPALAERIARALQWRVDPDGFLRLASNDPGVPIDADWADASFWIAGDDPGHPHLLQVTPGCDLSDKEPDLGGSDVEPELKLHEGGTVPGGRWCVDDTYSIDMAFLDRPHLQMFYKRLDVVAAPPA